MRLYHVKKYSSCGVYISLCGYITWKAIKVEEYIYHCVAISRGKVLKLRSIYIIVWLYHLENFQSCGVDISMCGYITWKSINVADYIYHCAAISRGKVLKLRSIYISFSGYIKWKSIKVGEYTYHCVTISPGKLSKLRSIYIIMWLYHVQKY